MALLSRYFEIYSEQHLMNQKKIMTIKYNLQDFLYLHFEV